MAEERDGGLSLATFVAGVIVGAALAILITPEPGTEMRKKLKKVTDKARDIATEKAKQLLETEEEEEKEEEADEN